jgi:MFS family permease
MLRPDAATPLAAKTPVPWLAIAAVTATVSVFAIAQGLSYPLLSFILGRQGVSPTMIGLSAAMSPLGMMISASQIPAIVKRLGGITTVTVCSLACATLFALIGLTQNVWLWFPLRFMLGMSVIPLYVLSEVWMMSLAPPQQRGRFMGAYTSIISLGFASGPATLAVIGTQGVLPFALGFSAFLICGLFVRLASTRLPPFHEDEQQGTVRRFLPAAPTLLVAVWVAAATETSMLALFPTYGRSMGLAEQQLATLLTIFFFGNVALQIPLGLVAERLSARTVMVGCAFLGTCGCALLPLVLATPWQWPVIFFWGAFSYGMYTMSVIELGQRFSGTMLVAGNAAFAMMWGFGGIAGPPFSGSSMQVLGPHGLPLVLGIFSTGLLLVGVVRARMRAA